MENPGIINPQPDIRDMIRDTVNEAVADAMAEVKSLLAQTATKTDVKQLQDQIDAHQKALAAHDGKIEDQKLRVDSLDLFKKTIEEVTGRMERSVSSAVELINQRDEQYQKRMELLDDRLSSNERRTSELGDEIHSVAKADADTRLRMEQVIPSLHKAMFGDPAEKRAGVITTLETTNTRINQMGTGFAEQLGLISASLKPMLDNHLETAARKQRAQARRKWIAGQVFSYRGMAVIGAVAPFFVPWAIRWIQVHINLHPALIDMLNQISQIISLYAGK